MLQTELTDIITALKIISDDSFSFGRKIFNSSQSTFSPPVDQVQDPPLVLLMKDVFYGQCYCRKFSGQCYQSPVDVGNNVQAFQAALSQANETVERWDNDWIIEQILPGGQYLAKKKGKYKLVLPGEFINLDYSVALPKEGARVSIHCLKESLTFQPSFYFVFSNEINSDTNLISLARFYFNIKSTGAAQLIQLLTRQLNKYKIPFSFKCLNNPALFTRSDAAVLYVTKPYYHITSQVLSKIYPNLRSEMDSHVPLFTKKLYDGLSIAEDPGNGDSFGMHRCRLLARGIYNSYLNNDTSAENILQSVEQSFKASGISLDTPYMISGEQNDYLFNNPTT
jgi:hypothetical protein